MAQSSRAALEHVMRGLTPKRMRPLLSRAYYAMLDAGDAVAGRRDPLTPPRSLRRISTDPDNDYRATGREFVAFLARECGVGADAAILDVGCGVGRIAVGLTEYLSEAGRYDGFDIVPAEIEWCRQQITPRFPQFRFQVADLRNDAYNPAGATPASQYRFPFPDRSFDVAIVASVFTHLLTPDLDNYLRELARVLVPGGRAVASFYLLNHTTRSHIAAGRSAFQFTTPIGDAMVNDADRPSWAVAHDEDRVRAALSANRLQILKWFPGRWASEGVQVQDLVIVEKAPG
jgi:SAM-dependent methyltransferase